MKIVCFGNSLTACGGTNGRFSDILQERFPKEIFINKGTGGDTFIDARMRIKNDVFSLHPDIVLIEFGANDWWQDERPYTEWAADLEYCLSSIKKNGAEIVVLGVFGYYQDSRGELVPKETGTDRRGTAFQELECEIARKHGCAYIPNIQKHIINNRCCWLDSNHSNEYGNRYIADSIESAMEKLLGYKALPVRKPILNTLPDIWHESIALAPEKCAVVQGKHHLTYKEADSLIRRIAAGILKTCNTSRPKVAIFLPNCLEYYFIYWAVACLGGIIVPLNTWLKQKALSSILANVSPDLLITQSTKDSVLLGAAQDAPHTHIVALDGPHKNIQAYTKLLEQEEWVQEPADIQPHDPAIIMHTSGTTGTPKGAVMRHEDLLFNIMTTINAHQFCPEDIHLLVNPMFHCTPLYSSLPAAAYQKAQIVITATTTPERLMKLVEKDKITTFLSTPFIFQRITALSNLKSFDRSSLRLIAYAGSHMPIKTIHKMQKLFPGVELHNFFGLTETISMTHVLTGEEAESRPDSIGKLLPFVEAKIVDKDNAEVPPGEKGELLFRRDNVVSGYYNEPKKIKNAILNIDEQEWFSTGDLAIADEEGYFFIKGRKKDMIIVGGENVFSGEIENILMEHNKVEEAAVKGIPATGRRAPLGELIKAYVVPVDKSVTERDIKKHCLDQLASYKVPHFVVFLNSLPRNPMGKVIKSELP